MGNSVSRPETERGNSDDHDGSNVARQAVHDTGSDNGATSASLFQWVSGMMYSAPSSSESIQRNINQPQALQQDQGQKGDQRRPIVKQSRSSSQSFQSEEESLEHRLAKMEEENARLAHANRRLQQEVAKKEQLAHNAKPPRQIGNSRDDNARDIGTCNQGEEEDELQTTGGRRTKTSQSTLLLMEDEPMPDVRCITTTSSDTISAVTTEQPSPRNNMATEDDDEMAEMPISTTTDTRGTSVENVRHEQWVIRARETSNERQLLLQQKDNPTMMETGTGRVQAMDVEQAQATPSWSIAVQQNDHDDETETTTASRHSTGIIRHKSLHSSGLGSDRDPDNASSSMTADAGSRGDDDDDDEANTLNGTQKRSIAELPQQNDEATKRRRLDQDVGEASKTIETPAIPTAPPPATLTIPTTAAPPPAITLPLQSENRSGKANEAATSSETHAATAAATGSTQTLADKIMEHRRRKSSCRSTGLPTRASSSIVEGSDTARTHSTPPPPHRAMDPPGCKPSTEGHSPTITTEIRPDQINSNMNGVQVIAIKEEEEEEHADDNNSDQAEETKATVQKNGATSAHENAPDKNEQFADAESSQADVDSDSGEATETAVQIIAPTGEHQEAFEQSPDTTQGELVARGAVVDNVSTQRCGFRSHKDALDPSTEMQDAAEKGKPASTGPILGWEKTPRQAIDSEKEEDWQFADSEADLPDEKRHPAQRLTWNHSDDKAETAKPDSSRQEGQESIKSVSNAASDQTETDGTEKSVAEKQGDEEMSQDADMVGTERSSNEQLGCIDQLTSLQQSMEKVPAATNDHNSLQSLGGRGDPTVMDKACTATGCATVVALTPEDQLTNKGGENLQAGVPLLHTRTIEAVVSPELKKASCEIRGSNQYVVQGMEDVRQLFIVALKQCSSKGIVGNLDDKRVLVDVMDMAGHAVHDLMAAAAELDNMHIQHQPCVVAHWEDRTKEGQMYWGPLRCHLDHGFQSTMCRHQFCSGKIRLSLALKLGLSFAGVEDPFELVELASDQGIEHESFRKFIEERQRTKLFRAVYSEV